MSTTTHARERMQQRHITLDDIETVVHFGRRANSADCHVYRLSAVDTCRANLPRRLAGIVVVVGYRKGFPEVVTTYHRGR